jgi:site-specific DNA recombinase
MTRAAIYARYSSDNQRDASIEDQIRLCLEHLQHQGWSLAGTFTDRAVSGASHLRPEYQRLLEQARAGMFDVVVAEALDRLSRDQEHTAALYKQLSFCGVQLVTLAEGAINEMHVGLKGTMNALFLKDLAAKTKRGQRGRIEAGLSAGGNSYGYAVVREVDARGEAVRGGRQIDAAEAAAVRRIFADFAQGHSPRQIAHALNAESVPGPAGSAWGPSTINGNAARGTGILNNELYVGRLVWNRLQYRKDPRTGKWVSRRNPTSAWIVQEVPNLRIIDQDLWDRAKARQRTLRKNTRPDRAPDKPFWDQRRARYLFSGLVKCGCCGGGFVVISKYLYGCAAARNKGTCTNRLNIRRDVLEVSVLDGLKSRLMDPALFKIFAEEFVAEVNRLRRDESAVAERLTAEHATVERKLRKIVDAIAEGVPARTLKDELLALEQRQEELQAKLESATATPQLLLHPNLAELYRRKVADLHAALQREETRVEAAEIVRSLIDAITLTPENGHLRIDLTGQLAGILALASDSKKPATGVGDGLLAVEQIKLVAGARNQRCLHISEAWIPRTP